MSSSGRPTSKGGKGTKVEKTHKTDGKPDPKKGGGDKIHKETQLSKNDELSIKEKVRQLMDLTRRTEDEVCLALHENDNDLNLAINFLFEEITTGEWETKDKKKKKRQASAGKQDKKNNEESGGGGGGSDDWEEVLPPISNNTGGGGGDGKEWKERGGRREGEQRGGRGGPPRGGRGGWRDDGGSNRGGDRRGGGRGGSTRGGGGGGRGRGGGRGGRYPPRGGRGGPGGGRDYNRQPIDTWDNSNTWDNSTAATTNHTAPIADDWDDFHTDEWSTEEYTGSLVETKVFTPSTTQQQQDGGGGGGLQQLEQPPQPPVNNIDHSSGSTQLDANTYSQSLQYQSVPQMPAQQTSPVPAAMVGRLTDAQTQYFSQLSQQNNEALSKQYGSGTYQAQTQNAYDGTKANVQQVYNSSVQTYTPITQSYSASAQQQCAYGSGVQQQPAQTYNAAAVSQQQSYNNSSGSGAAVVQQQQPYAPQTTVVSQQQQYGGTAQSYGSAAATVQQTGYGYGQQQEVVGGQQTQPQRSKQRARVPPPSKIPASAVEMPGDLNSSITYLDVQFGALDLMDNSFESNAASEVKYGTDTSRNSTVLEGNSHSTPTSGLDLNSSGTAGPNQSAIETVYNAPTKNGTQSSISSALSQALSSDSIPQQSSEHLSYNSGNKVQHNASQGSATTSVPTVTTPSGLDLNKQANDAHSSYNSQANYNSYQSKSNNYTPSAYNTTQTTASSYVNPSATSYQQVASSGYASQNSAPTQSANAAYAGAATQAAAYQNANSYQPTAQQQQQQQSYASSAQGPTSYGANTGLTNNSSYSSSSQYSSYNSSGGAGKLGSKENSYDNSVSSATVVSGTSSTTSNNAAAVSSAGGALSSLSQSTISSSKSTATLAKNTTSVMSNIPPGVAAPVMSTPYIMGQMPYFQQPVYSYEDVQMLQQRLPHMTPTTLATVRGDPTVAAALGGYPATAADGRFQTGGRATDGTTSPVPNAASQQQQQQQPQQILATPGAAQPYFFTAFNALGAPPNYPQFGAMYTTQLPAVTNAHGSSANSQYGPKPGTYGSAAGYGGYDALGQSAAAQDYAKGGYSAAAAAAAAAAAQQAAAQKGGQGNSTTAGSVVGNDLTAAMYGKSHAALGKVNSYEKQGFHSGTPPPFTGALSQSAGTGYAPAQVYIPTMPQHHSTMAMHQPLHQMDVRHQGRRADSGNSSSQRSQGSNQSKSGSKQGGYGAASYWNQN
ncbi:protein lingerer isoform X2 [Anthonomus grandis grandis]|uniref:protein lingerer isoform X2 n=1 Tax=Anthonomus grandis grandis TaxID=2921223 RepID=UPI002164FA7B|nr:protein lingerer isoform X2 [Anthonomus grandis grandis]